MIKLKVKRLKSLKEKSIGLLKNKKPVAVFFKTRFGIHTFFLRFPIDIVILDQNDKVVCLKKKLKQNRIYLWPVKFEKVIELAEGEIDRLNLKIGSKVEISEKT